MKDNNEITKQNNIIISNLKKCFFYKYLVYKYLQTASLLATANKTAMCTGWKEFKLLISSAKVFKYAVQPMRHAEGDKYNEIRHQRLAFLLQ